MHTNFRHAVISVLVPLLMMGQPVANVLADCEDDCQAAFDTTAQAADDAYDAAVAVCDSAFDAAYQAAHDAFRDQNDQCREDYIGPIQQLRQDKNDEILACQATYDHDMQLAYAALVAAVANGNPVGGLLAFFTVQSVVTLQFAVCVQDVIDPYTQEMEDLQDAWDACVQANQDAFNEAVRGPNLDDQGGIMGEYNDCLDDASEDWTITMVVATLDYDNCIDDCD